MLWYDTYPNTFLLRFWALHAELVLRAVHGSDKAFIVKQRAEDRSEEGRGNNECNFAHHDTTLSRHISRIRCDRHEFHFPIFDPKPTVRVSRILVRET